MACCKVCCGCKECDEGEEGKCCCGSECCQPDTYCCNAECVEACSEGQEGDCKCTDACCYQDEYCCDGECVEACGEGGAGPCKCSSSCCAEGEYCCDGECQEEPCGCVDPCDCPIRWQSGLVNLGTIGGCPDPPPTWTTNGLPLVATWTCLGDVGEGMIAGYFTADLLGEEADLGCCSTGSCIVYGYVNDQEWFEVTMNLVLGHCCDGECQEEPCDP